MTAKVNYLGFEEEYIVASRTVLGTTNIRIIKYRQYIVKHNSVNDFIKVYSYIVSVNIFQL